MRNKVQEKLEPKDVDLSSFALKKELNPHFWKDGKLDKKVRRALLVIARDYMRSINLKRFKVKDIIITGSIANYNWSEKYSDIDLHLVCNFSKISKNVDLVSSFFDAYKKNWNATHENIEIYGYSVEVYVQSDKEEHDSSGVYSLIKDEWIAKPSLERFSGKPNNNNIKRKVAMYANRIDDLENAIKNAKDDETLQSINKDAKQLFMDIKDARKMSLRNGHSEMTDDNLIFKALRRNGYIEKLLKIRTESYDRMLSVDL